MNVNTWKPCNTNEIVAKSISDYNKLKKKQNILMNYTIRGFCVMENLEIMFPVKKGEKRNKKFIIKYRYGKSFFERLISLFKSEEGHYEIYTEQEGY